MTINKRRPPSRAVPILAAALLLTTVILLAPACRFVDDSETEFMAYCTDRYGWDYSTRDCQCYWQEMRDDDIAAADIIGRIRADHGVDLRAGLSHQRAHDRCFN